MYKITNISRYLAFKGLYPGNKKEVSVIDSELLDLQSKGYCKIEEVKNKTNVAKITKKEENNTETINDDKKKSEVEQ